MTRDHRIPNVSEKQKDGYAAHSTDDLLAAVIYILAEIADRLNRLQNENNRLRREGILPQGEVR